MKPATEDLIRLYHTNKMTLAEIAKMYNVTITAIRSRMDRLGIPRRSNSESQILSNGTSDITKETVEKLYIADGLSQSEIARLYGVTQGAIKQKMAKYKIPTRGKSNFGQKNGMYGRTHTPEAIEKIKAANKRQFDNPENREKYAILTCNQIKDGRTGKSYNKLEQAVAAILDENNIVYEQQYRIGRFLYDFFIPSRNTLIESHGTFWHADKRFYSDKSLSEIQVRNTANDIKKSDRALSDGYRLIVVWEDDIMSGRISISDLLP